MKNPSGLKEIKWWGMLDLKESNLTNIVRAPTFAIDGCVGRPTSCWPPPGYAGPDRIGRVQGRKPTAPKRL